MKLMSYPGLNSPFSLLDDLFRESFDALTRAQHSHPPQIEWFEDDDHYFARLDLPGVSRVELSVSFEDQLVTLSISDGEKESKLSVPDGIEIENAEAHLTDGVLVLELPKSPEKRPVSIEVK